MSNSTTAFSATINIGILVFDDFEPLDVWGFIEAFSISRFIGTGYSSEGPYPFKIVLISNKMKHEDGTDSPLPVRSYNGPSVVAERFRDDELSDINVGR